MNNHSCLAFNLNLGKESHLALYTHRESLYYRTKLEWIRFNSLYLPDAFKVYEIRAITINKIKAFLTTHVTCHFIAAYIYRLKNPSLYMREYFLQQIHDPKLMK